MPRFREPGSRREPQIRQPQGNPNLPDTGSVMVDLSRVEPERPQLVYGSSAYSIPAGQAGRLNGSIPLDTRPVEPEPPPVVPVTAVDADEGEEDPSLSLRKTRERVKTRREQSLEAANQQLQQWGTQQAHLAAVAAQQVNQSNLDTVSSALAQAEAEASAAEQAHADAWAKGDGLGVAKAIRAINDAQYRINTLRAGRDELETTVKTPPRPAAPPQGAADQNVELILSQMRDLRDDERDWIRQHPDAISQANQNRLRVAFDDSQRKGLKRGSPQYFAFLEDRLDYADEPDVDVDPYTEQYEEEPLPEPRRPQRAVPAREPMRRVSAPVSRAGMGQGALPPGKIILNEACLRLTMQGVSSVLQPRRGPGATGSTKRADRVPMTARLARYVRELPLAQYEALYGDGQAFGDEPLMVALVCFGHAVHEHHWGVSLGLEAIEHSYVIPDDAAADDSA
jgi:hypothetical protein